MSRRVGSLLVVVLMVVSLALGACATKDDGESSGPLRVRIGTQPIEAALPIWVAESEGLFDEEGLDAQVTHYESATDRNVAMQGGTIDCMLASPIALGLLEQGGYGVSAVGVLHGSTPEQGRDGIVVPPGSAVKSLGDLEGRTLGTSTATRLDFVVDCLLRDAGVPSSGIKMEEVKKTSIRYELMMSGKLDAAALPEPWLTLAEAQGARVIADSADENLCEEIMLASDKWLDTPDGAEAMKRTVAALDEAARMINDHPERYRSLLVEKAGVPEEISDSYPVSHYPRATLPSETPLMAQLQWMADEGLIETSSPYAELIWDPSSH